MAKDCYERGSFNDMYDAINECRRLEEKYGEKYSYFLCPSCEKYHVRQDNSSNFAKSKCSSRFGEKKGLYKTIKEAREALMQSSSSAVDFYWCSKCQDYHLTSHFRNIKGHRK